MIIIGATLSPSSASLDVKYTQGCIFLSEKQRRGGGGHTLSFVIFTAEAILYHAGSLSVVSTKLKVKKDGPMDSPLSFHPSPEITQTFLINMEASFHLKLWQNAYLFQAAKLTAIWQYFVPWKTGVWIGLDIVTWVRQLKTAHCKWESGKTSYHVFFLLLVC